LSAANGNGSRGWTVEKHDRFLEDQERLEAEHSRLGDVFAVVERLFEAIPNLNAVQVSDETWVYQTRGALGAPAVVLYYEIRPDEQIVNLLAAVLA
jgi:hypothetical protein